MMWFLRLWPFLALMPCSFSLYSGQGSPPLLEKAKADFVCTFHLGERHIQQATLPLNYQLSRLR